MISQPDISSSHAVYLLRLHIVIVTKYSRKVISPEIMGFLETAFRGVLEAGIADWKNSVVKRIMCIFLSVFTRHCGTEYIGVG